MVCNWQPEHSKEEIAQDQVADWEGVGCCHRNTSPL